MTAKRKMKSNRWFWKPYCKANQTVVGQSVHNVLMHQRIAAIPSRIGGMHHRNPAVTLVRRLTLHHYLRGLPAGYLNSLEKRLLETERALFFALAEIHANSRESDDYSSAGSRLIKPSPQTKADLVQSWQRHPLQNRGDAKSWFYESQNVPSGTSAPLTSTATPVGPAQSVRSPPNAHTDNEQWPLGLSMGVPLSGNSNPDSPMNSRFHDPGRLGSAAQWGASGIESPNVYHDMPPAGSSVYNPQESPSTPSDIRSVTTQQPRSVAGSAQKGRASGFARENQNIYF